MVDWFSGTFSGILPEWLLALGLTLFLVDLLVFHTDFISWVGVVSLAGYTTLRLHPNGYWALAVFLLSGVIWWVAYYAFFREIVGRIVRRTLTKGSPDDSIDRIVGAEGRIRIVEGKPFFLYNGEELLPIADSDSDWRENDRVRVCSRKGAEVELSRL